MESLHIMISERKKTIEDKSNEVIEKSPNTSYKQKNYTEISE